MRRFLDVSGFGHSGKTVVTDLLREFHGYWVPHSGFEFDLLRVPGGLGDLYQAMTEGWSPIRSDAAVRRFARIADRMGTAARVWSPASWGQAYGTNYDTVFGARYRTATRSFIKSLFEASFETEWPYSSLEDGWWRVCTDRVLRSLGVKPVSNRTLVLAPPTDRFAAESQFYLDSLFDAVVEADTRVVVLNNSLEPFEPQRLLPLLPGGKAIVVQRDPRDTYASLFIRDGAFVPGFEANDRLWRLKASFLGAEDVDVFIRRQRILNDACRFPSERTGTHVLRLRFEEIVLNYDAVVARILRFLGEDPAIHVSPRAHFDPDLSAKNVGLWRLADRRVMDRIAAGLPDLCFKD